MVRLGSLTSWRYIMEAGFLYNVHRIACMQIAKHLTIQPFSLPLIGLLLHDLVTPNGPVRCIDWTRAHATTRVGRYEQVVTQLRKFECMGVCNLVDLSSREACLYEEGILPYPRAPSSAFSIYILSSTRPANLLSPSSSFSRCLWKEI